MLDNAATRFAAAILLALGVLSLIYAYLPTEPAYPEALHFAIVTGFGYLWALDFILSVPTLLATLAIQVGLTLIFLGIHFFYFIFRHVKASSV